MYSVVIINQSTGARLTVLETGNYLNAAHYMRDVAKTLRKNMVVRIYRPGSTIWYDECKGSY